MSTKIIEISQRNTSRVTCTTSISATGYTPYLTVKKKSADAIPVLSKTGLVSDSSTVIFNLSSVDTSIAVGDYVYDIVLEADASIYTVVKNAFSILDGVRY